MQLTLNTLLPLLLITPSLAQWLNNVNVPACARSCAAALPSTCAGNPKCVCRDTTWMIKTQCCVAASCSPADRAVTEQFAAQLCNYVGSPVTRPSACPGVSLPQSSTLSSAANKPTTTPTSTGGAATSTAETKTVDGAKFAHDGCYSEANNGGRILDKTYYIDIVGNTIEKCIGFCKVKGASLAGVEYSQECWCGNEIKNGGKKLDGNDAKKCNLPCKGDSKQSCGGMAVVEVWKAV